MSFFKNLSEKVGSVAESAVDKASDFAEITKLNSSISSEKKQIEALFIKIGQQIFENEKDNPDSPFADLISQIVSSQSTIAKLQSKIDNIKSGN
jgi:hypothetical protein